jgi:hypothetical protein
MITEDMFIKEIRKSEDGVEFIQDDKEHLFRNWKNTLRGKFEVGTNVKGAGEWKQGKKRKYFNIEDIVTEGEEVIEVKSEEVAEKVEEVMPHKTEAPKYKADPDKIESIERQSSLKSAVEWCSVKVQAGVDIKTEEVIKVAQKFLEYIKG